MLRRSSVFTAALLTALAIELASASEQPPRIRINYLAYPVHWSDKAIEIGGRLQVPLDVAGKVPAVVILHGTLGVAYTGIYYAEALNRAGISTLEIDQWGGRGLQGGAASRPKGLADNLSDVAGAYRLLAARPEIDSDRIGLMGSSMGGIETMLMMTRRNSDAVLGPGVHFRAAVALYPACWLYNHAPGADFSDLVDAPVRILVGSEDDYEDRPDSCEGVVRDLSPGDAAHLSVHVFPGATHLFDSFDGSREYQDPAAHARKGGVVRVQPDAQVREQARDDLVRFFETAFKLK